ncbi:MAG: UrcA family protein [Acidimicrobiales bacterium]|nr:UrcA family protein [Hyphomonadaceae bacterium]RZV43021.1 MAG: UrcA family protein [Acidimicrobiales bacterium]
MKIQQIAIAIGAILLSLTTATGSQAKDFEVRFNKAELETAAGAERVYHRLYDVAEDLCQYEFSHSFATKSKLRFDRCVRRTVKEFVWQVDHPKVDQAYAALPVRRIKDRKIRTAKFLKNKTR